MGDQKVSNIHAVTKWVLNKLVQEIDSRQSDVHFLCCFRSSLFMTSRFYFDPSESEIPIFNIIVTSSAIDKMFEIFGPIFEQNVTINFEPIFEQNANFGPIFEKSAYFGPIFEKSVNFEHFVNGK